MKDLRNLTDLTIHDRGGHVFVSRAAAKRKCRCRAKSEQLKGFKLFYPKVRDRFCC